MACGVNASDDESSLARFEVAHFEPCARLCRTQRDQATEAGADHGLAGTAKRLQEISLGSGTCEPQRVVPQPQVKITTAPRLSARVWGGGG
jgi:hypothetical protein